MEKKYVRTKDGKIFEYGGREKTPYGDFISINGEHFKYDSILKEADNIEELIMPGDLVRYDVLYMSWIEKDRGNKVRGIDMHLIPRKSVDMLWIPTGNDTECYPNFKLVASKENEKGELELL